VEGGLTVEKQKAAKTCRIVGFALGAAFLVNLAVDWWRYSTTLNSAPFWVTAAVDGICLLLPAAVLLAVGCILGKK